MSVRDAIQSVGITESHPRRSQSSSAIINVERRLAWSNLRRRPARLVATLTALALGGAALMTAQNVYRGLIGTVDAALTARGDDVDVRLLRGAPRAEIEAAVRAVPGVTYVEGWGSMLASIRVGESSDEWSIGTTRYPVSAPPSDSRMPRPRLVAGRRFDVDAAGEAVLNRGLLDRESQLRVGADVVLLTAGRQTPVRIVGVVEEVGAPGLYVSPATMAQLVGTPDDAGALRIAVTAGQQAQVASAVEELLVDRGWFPLAVMTRENLRAAMVDHFLIMLALLSSAAIAALIVGALSLATSIGLSVLERSREIGVMRAIGASDNRIRRLLFTEGAIGEHGLHVTMPFSVSVQAFVAWGVAAALVLVLASLLPARTALLSPVREVLAQE
jgi:putative ABC transport system permease protein